MRAWHIIAALALLCVGGLYAAKEVFFGNACAKVRNYFASRNWSGDVSCTPNLLPFGMSIGVNAERLDLTEADFSKLGWTAAEIVFSLPAEIYAGPKLPLQPEFIVRLNKSGVFIKEEFPPGAF